MSVQLHLHPLTMIPGGTEEGQCHSLVENHHASGHFWDEQDCHLWILTTWLLPAHPLSPEWTRTSQEVPPYGGKETANFM